MNRLAASHPEDDRYQSLEGQREVLSEKADRDDLPPFCPRCHAEGRTQIGRSPVRYEPCETHREGA